MRIIHFSDFHLRPNNNLAQSQDLLAKMISALDSVNIDKKIDLIVFSGDMIDRGGDGFSSPQVAFGNFKSLVIDVLLNKLGLAEDRFIFVPGNHDIQQKEDKPFEENGLYGELTSNKKIDDFVHDPTNLEHIRRIVEFNKFKASYYTKLKNVEFYNTPLQANIVLTIEGKRVGITMINSAWRCYDSKTDKGRILIGESQILDSVNILKTCDVKIAISHHDYNWVRDFERPNLPRLIMKNYDMFFCGHTHGADAEFVSRPEGNTFFFTAPGLLHANIHELDGHYKNGFMVIDYLDSEHVVKAYKYMQFDDQEFKIDKNYGEFGCWEHEIPRGELAKRNERLTAVYSHIQEIIPNLNAHLIGYSTSTKSPKSINEIFVMPKLQYKEQSGDNIDTLKVIDISSINALLKIEGNVIIYGDKESGKTILLDKIFIDVTNCHRTDNMIPVQINFNAINGNNLLQLFGNYWDQTKNDAQEILKDKRIVLLIDDIDFSDDGAERIDCIVTFLKNHSNVKLIGTAYGRNSISALGPSEHSIPYCKSIQISAFKAEQIRELASKWYHVDNNDDFLREKIDFIINAFGTFKIPCTPFSVTLLLWILEKGDQIQPTNSAILLDTFMLEMLKDRTGGYGKEKFNQYNKTRLLSLVAFEMYNEELNSIKEQRMYNFTIGKLTSLTETHLCAMEMKAYKAQKIIADMINAGILTRNKKTNNVYFRFRCFMEYFLAKYMSVSKEFFEYVLSEENYLNFSNVINYYTGFTSDKVSILNKIITRLEIEFLDLSNLLGDKIKTDDYFIQKGLLEAIDNPELKYLTLRKHTVKDDDKRSNVLLDQNTVKAGEQPKNKQEQHVNSFRVYSDLLLLAMDVLKNTEEVEETGFSLKLAPNEQRSKAECFKIVLENFTIYTVVSYLVCMRFLKKYEEKQDPAMAQRMKELSILLFLLPVLYEEVLRDHLGSAKLLGPIKEKLETDFQKSDSEVQQFMTVFLYSDLKGSDYLSHLSNFIKKSKRAIVRDSSFLKLQYYYYNSNNEKLDKKLVGLMADLYIASHKSNNTKEHFDRSKIIANLMKKDKS